MAFLVSNCEKCIHKEVCGIKKEYNEFVEQVETIKELANNSSNFDAAAECKHCKVK